MSWPWAVATSDASVLEIAAGDFTLAALAIPSFFEIKESGGA
jgi:hypothetical protein